MTDVTHVFSPLVRATDNSGNLVADGTVEFYLAGTSTPLTVYSDRNLSVALGTTVDTDSSGYPVTGGGARTIIYTGTADYKVIIKDSLGVTIVTHDNIPGAIAIPVTDELALPETPVSSKTTTYTIVVGDQGKLLDCNPTGGSFALTLLSAVTAGDGFRVGVRHAANSSNVVTIRSTGGETIGIPGKAATSFSLKGWGEAIWLVSNGAGWLLDTQVPPLMLDSLPFFRVTDRTTTPPVSPVGGTRYIINGSPVGAWATAGYADEQVVESDGNGGWFAYAPAAGWFAYVIDEDLLTKYDGANWEDQTGMGAPSSSVLKEYIVVNSQADGAGGGTATSGSWATIPINAAETVASAITGASLASNQVTLPTGNYLVVFAQPFYGTYVSRARFKSTTTASVIYSDTVQAGVLAVGPSEIVTGATALGMGTITVTDPAELFELHYYVSQTRATSGLGIASTSAGVTETYARVTIIDLASLQGPAGIQGNTGEDGIDAGHPYQWNTATSGDPGAGKVLVNNATLASLTQINISETDVFGNTVGISTWDDSTNPVRATIRLTLEGASGSAANFIEVQITGAGTDQGAYWTFPATYTSSGGTISNGNDIALLNVRAGNKGVNAGYAYQWSTATSGDPGTGKVRINNAALASATSVAVNETDANGITISLSDWDDSTSSIRGHIRIGCESSAAFAVYAITSAGTDNGTYWTWTVTHVASGGTLSANDYLSVLPIRTGDKGDTGTQGIQGIQGIPGMGGSFTMDTLDGNLEMYRTVAFPVVPANAMKGAFTKEGFRWIHDFNYGNNGTVTTTGCNVFIGYDAGNYTMGATATDIDEASINTGVGYISLNALTLGNHNAAFGAYSGWKITTGSWNTLLGTSAGYNTTTGGLNTYIGFRSGLENLTGSYNCTVGSATLNSGTDASYNVAIGNGALYANVTGDYNVSIGYGSLAVATTDSNTALGTYAGQLATTGNNNMFLGYFCMGAVPLTGSNNTLIGGNLGGLSTTAAQWVVVSDGAGVKKIAVDNSGNCWLGTITTVLTGITGATHNVGIGNGANASLTTGDYNVALGQSSLNANSTGSGNMAIGFESLYNTVGSAGTAHNVGIGYYAGRDNTTGQYNTYVGFNAGRTVTANSATGNRNTIIGANVTGLGDADSNRVVIADGTGNRRFYSDNNGNIGIGYTTTSPTFGTSSVKSLAIPHGTAPTTSVAGQVQITAVSASGLYCRDENGVVTKFGSGIGYATGSGGTVTQATSKATGVTLDKLTGTITMNNAALAAATSVGFTLTNNTIAATDLIIVNLKSGGTADAYDAFVDAVAAGSCHIRLRNESGGSLSEAVVLSYAVIKGVAA